MRAAAFVVVVLGGLVARPVWATIPRNLTQLSLEELGEIEVTSVSKKPEKLSEAADAVYVITQEDIRRSGAGSIADALRLAPGVQVAQIDSNKWAIGVRGFTSRLSRSLLVLVDGRSVYTPLFAGTYWEVQDLVLEDIDRIEVIRGPGGTLWGANAVNGVINIITKNAAETRGGLLKLWAGTEERLQVATRYGGALGERSSWRAYGKWLSRDGGFHTDTPEFDDWHKAQVGFRADSLLASGDRITLQGNAYKGDFGQRAGVAIHSPPFSRTLTGDGELSGANLLARWSFGRGRTESSLQSSFDRTSRKELTFEEDRNTFDLDWQQRVQSLFGGQDVVWGAGYRITAGSTGGDFPTVRFVPRRKTEDVLSAFVQDEIALGRGFHVTVGSKFEHNDYSGFEVQPTARLAWASPERKDTVWTSVSRAVRTPTRTDTDLVLDANIVPGSPVFARVFGSKDFEPERVIAYEAGYRTAAIPRLLLDVAAFYNDYKRLLSLESGTPFNESVPPPPRVVVPLFEQNKLEGHSYGAELVARIDVAAWWRVNANYSLLRLRLFPEESSNDTSQVGAEGASPHHQALLWSSFSFGGHVEADTILRHVGQLPAQQVPQYTELDVNLSWRPRADLTLSLVGRNLLDDHHPEFGPPPGRVEMERSVLGRASWTW